MPELLPNIPIHLVVHLYEERQCVLVQEPPLSCTREDLDGSNEPGVDIPPPPGTGLWVWEGTQALVEVEGRRIEFEVVYGEGAWRRPSVHEIGALIEGARWPHAARLEAACSGMSGGTGQ